MLLLKFIMSATILVAGTLAASRTSPPSGAYVVAKSGGSYSTIQSAVDAIPKSSSGSYTIFIEPGIYSEQVLIPTMTGSLTIYGSTTNDQDYTKNTVTLTNRLGADDAGSNDASGTMRAKANNFAVFNINVINSRGQGDQAIAISAYGDEQGYYGCQFIGYQDTVLSNDGRHAFKNCYIEGATDFIFGRRGVGWFEGCTIGIVGQGFITADGRQSSDNPSYYVINDCSVVDKAGVGTGATYLGRPWGEYARVVVQNSNLGSVVNSAGWRIWNTGDERIGNVFFGEYGNYGPGSSGSRASFSTAMGNPVSIGSILGSTGWIDSNYWDNTGSDSGGNPSTTTTSAPLETTTSSGGCSQSIYGQCGGIGYTGCSNCAGSTCTFSNDWYSQCL